MEGWMVVDTCTWSDKGLTEHHNLVTRFYSGDGKDIAHDVYEWNPYWRFCTGLFNKAVCLALIPFEIGNRKEFSGFGMESDQQRELESLYWVKAAYNRGIDLAIGAGAVSVSLDDYKNFSKIYSLNNDEICFRNEEGTWRWSGPFRDKQSAQRYAENLVSWNHTEDQNGNY